MPASIVLIDPDTGSELTAFNAGTLRQPTADNPSTNTPSKLLRVRNIGDGILDGDLTLAPRPGFGLQGSISDAIVTLDEVTSSNDTGTMIQAIRREPLGNPSGFEYVITCTQASPPLVNVVTNGGSPSADIAVVANGSTFNINVIPGVGIQFKSGLVLNEVSTVLVVAPAEYALTFRNNSGLEGRVGNFPYGPIIADGVTFNALPDIPGILFQFPATLTTANAGTTTAKLKLYPGGRYLEVSEDNNVWAKSVDLTPPNNNLVPYRFPFTWEVEISSGTGSLAAGTYSYLVTGKRAGNVSLVDESNAVSVEVLEDDAVTITLDDVSGGYTSWDIYRRLGTDPYARLVADYDFVANPTYTDTGAVTPSGVLPTTEPQLEVYARFARTFPALPSSIDRATIYTEGDSL